MDAADELYGGDPAAFVARRDELARAARTAGDRTGAAAIKALRRPTTGAWYVNAAVRAGLVSLREWLHLGERLREAQASGDFARVRSLGAGRARLESRVVRDLVAHLASVGVTASPAGLDEVRSTLRAALASAEASEQVLAGRLSRPLAYGGFGEVDLAAALAVAATPAPAEVPPDPEAADPEAAAPDAAGRAEREAAERERTRLERELVATRARLADAEAALQAAEERVEQARRALAAAERATATASGNVALLAEKAADLSARLAEAT